MSADGRISLEERLKSGPLPVDEAVRMVWGLCDRFEKTGRSESLGDVAPGRVTLHGRSVEVLIPDPLPVPHFSAPERQHSGPTPRSDVYAMGALLACALTGRPSQGGPLPPPAAHLQPVVDRCLSPDPQARFANLAELKRALVRLDKTLMSGPRSHSSLPAVRTSLGPWNLESLLGQGSMGYVYKARHQSLGRQAAIKVLRPEQYQQPELIQRFFQEARTVNQINHEHIVEISDFVQEPGESGPSAVYCVMEFLQGRTLGDLLEEQPISIERGLRIVEQLCDALAAAHRVGVVHRDVKPDNIMLIERAGSKDYVKVLDFGVAKLTDTDGKAMVATTEGAIIGTPICMSPEQAQGDSVDARSDIWAVGVILYKILTGNFPFDAATFVNIAVQIITRPYAPLPPKNRLGEPIPPRLAVLVQRCLEKRRESRPQTMDEVRDELRSILRGDKAPASVDRGRRWGLIASLVFGLAVAVGVGVWWSRAHEPPAARPAPLPPAVLLPTVPLEPVPELPLATADAGPADAGAEPQPVTAPPGTFDAGVPKPARGPPRPAIRLSDETVANAMSGLTAKFLGCARKYPDEAFQTDSTTLLVFSLERSGRIASAKMEGPGSGGGLEACLTGALRREGFPPIEGPIPPRLRLPVKLR